MKSPYENRGLNLRKPSYNVWSKATGCHYYNISMKFHYAQVSHLQISINECKVTHSQKHLITYHEGEPLPCNMIKKIFLFCFNAMKPTWVMRVYGKTYM